MDKQTEQIHVFFEISMAIGRSLDLKTMLRQALTVFLKKLNCSAAGVLFYKKDRDEYILEDSYVIPRIFLEKNNLLKDQLGMSERLNFDKKEQISALLSLNKAVLDNNYLVMELQDLGFFFLVRNRVPFNEYLIKSLNNLVSRLAGACIACYQNEELIQTKDNLGLRVKKRTAQLEKRNIDLNKAYSDLKNAQKQLIHNEKMASIGQLAAGVAHEINNPTGFISSNLYTMKEYLAVYKLLFYKMDHLIELLQIHNSDSVRSVIEEIIKFQKKEDFTFILEDACKLLDESIDGARRIKEIVLGLRNFARPSNSEYKLANINTAIEDAVRLTINELKYKCELVKKLGDLPDIPCRLDQLTQVFVNLLVNASQAIEEHGIVKVKTELNKEYVVISFYDNGSGIPEENLDKLFDPFFSTKEVGKGTGLGLSISHGIIEKHKGTIEVSSTLGEGTCFIIRLPVKGGDV